jgi:hypothetical protein
MEQAAKLSKKEKDVKGTKGNSDSKPASEEPYPISKELHLIKGVTIFKNEKKWTAVLLVEPKQPVHGVIYQQICLYVWRNFGYWRRDMKFTINSNEDATAITAAITKFKLAERKVVEQAEAKNDSNNNNNNGGK